MNSMTGRFLCLIIVSVSYAHATVEAAQIFTDHMVLQREIAVPVWGWAKAGETITVSIDGQEQKAVTGPDGRWQVRLAPLHLGAPRTLIISGAGETLRFSDILIGDVWVCAGQSNMVWSVSAAKDAKQEIAAATYPEIRLFEVGGGRSPRQVLDRFDPASQEGIMGPPRPLCMWQPCAPASVASFSAVGYYFGRSLQQHLKVPVGLIHTAVGATPVEAWMGHEALAANAVGRGVLDVWAARDAFAETADGKVQLQALAEASVKKFGKVGYKADGWLPPLNRLGHPSTFFNSRVHPLIPFAIKGVIWYQGEANTSYAAEYRTLFQTLITDWRAQWSQGDFPFLFVQLANWGGPPPEKPMPNTWAELREAQAQALNLPHTGMAVAIDVGDAAAMHPLNKQAVGDRLALAARAVAYGEQLLHSGPVFRSATVDSSRIRLTFDAVGGGLVARGGGPLRSFAIAGQDQVFVWADAVIQGDNTLVVSAAAVPQPVAVRYGWYHNPDCNLANAEGLPAAPFRTDTWPGQTEHTGFQAMVKKPVAFTIPK